MYGDIALILFTLNVLVPVPPVALKVILPFCPLQLGLVAVAVIVIPETGMVMVTWVELVHPFASVASIV